MSWCNGWPGSACHPFPEFTAYGVLAGVAGGLALIGWWLFFSRAGWSERLGVLVLMIAAMAATWPFLDVSISTGAMGFLFPMLAMPGLCLAFVLWAVASRRMSVGLQRATLVAAIVLPCGGWTLIRTGGFTGSFDNDLAWRWTATPEQRLLAQGDEFFDSAPGKPVDSVRGEVTTPASALATPVTPEDPAAAPAGKPFDATAASPSTSRGTSLRLPHSTGRDFADAIVTASFAAFGLTQIGQRRRRYSSGAGRSGQAGRRSRCMATFSTRRSSVVTTRSSPRIG